MRRTAAGIATTLLAALAISGPLATTSHAVPADVQCATAAPSPACALLDDLAVALVPVAPLLGTPLAGLAGTAQGFAARSDGAGVSASEVTMVATVLLAELRELPGPVQTLVGSAVLGDLTGTLEALLDELGTPITPGPEAAEASEPTPAKTTTPAAPASSSAGESSSLGGSVSSSGARSSTSSTDTSAAAVPDVPVGDPLTLGPLGLPDFGFNPTFEPAVAGPLVAPAPAQAALVDEVAATHGGGRGAELAVVVVLSLLLIAGAGIAQVQQSRHTIAD